MARQSDAESSSALLVSAMAGAVLGAAGLAWWLLSEAERRRLQPRQQRVLRLSRLTDAGDTDDSAVADSFNRPQESDLHDKVHELNQAIDEVRRQLEGMGSR
jgi:hypothetical protein